MLNQIFTIGELFKYVACKMVLESIFEKMLYGMNDCFIPLLREYFSPTNSHLFSSIGLKNIFFLLHLKP